MSPRCFLQEVRRRSLRLREGFLEVAEQHGRHDALLCVDGQQGAGGVLQLQRHQNNGAAADRPAGKPAGEEEHGGLTTNTK